MKYLLIFSLRAKVVKTLGDRREWEESVESSVECDPSDLLRTIELKKSAIHSRFVGAEGGTYQHATAVVCLTQVLPLE